MLGGFDGGRSSDGAANRTARKRNGERAEVRPGHTVIALGDRHALLEARTRLEFGATHTSRSAACAVEDRLAGTDAKRERSVIRRGYAAGESSWLFEGLSPGAHMTAAYIRLRLRELGIRPRVSRETRMNLLSMRMPSAVVADVIGIGNHTADRRKSKAGGIWSNYPAVRR